MQVPNLTYQFHGSRHVQGPQPGQPPQTQQAANVAHTPKCVLKAGLDEPIAFGLATDNPPLGKRKCSVWTLPEVMWSHPKPDKHRRTWAPQVHLSYLSLWTLAAKVANDPRVAACVALERDIEALGAPTDSFLYLINQFNHASLMT